MTSSEKVVYIAFVGHPVLEVAAIVTCKGQVIDIFHEFINYFNGILESYHSEQEPLTDSFGTRFEHAIGENELDQVGLSFCQVQEKLCRFISTHDTELTIIVNNLSLYQGMALPRDANRVWNLPGNKTFKTSDTILQGRRCFGHHSVYYQYDTKEPDCALTLAAMMTVHGSN